MPFEWTETDAHARYIELLQTFGEPMPGTATQLLSLNWAQLGFDSLDKVEFTMLVESEFDIDADNDDVLDTLATAGDAWRKLWEILNQRNLNRNPNADQMSTQQAPPPPPPTAPQPHVQNTTLCQVGGPDTINLVKGILKQHDPNCPNEQLHSILVSGTELVVIVSDLEKLFLAAAASSGVHPQHWEAVVRRYHAMRQSFQELRKSNFGLKGE